MLPPFKRGEPPAHLFIEPKSDELERLRAKLAKMEAAGDVLADVLYMHIDVGHMKQSDAAIFQWKESKK